MSEKTLTTRIQLRNADLASWNTSTLTLLAGEVALAKIETTQHDAATGNYYKVPTYLMKVGDGSKKFSELNWLAAPASDVHTWAKKAAMDYADLPETLKSEISSLKESVGQGGSVESQISAAVSAAIEGLDSPDTAVAKQFVTAVAMEDGSITVTRRELSADDIPELAISKITGLQTALDGKASLSEFNALKSTVGDSASGLVKGLADETANRTAADEALDAKIATINDTTIPAISARIDSNKTAAEAAQEAANKAQGEVDTLEGVVSDLTQTVETNRQAAADAVSTEASQRTAADEALQNAITALETAIGNVSNIMNFRGAVTAKTDITDPVEGDVIVVTDGDDSGKEFVYSNGSWVEFGSVTAQDTAISSLQTRMSTAEGKITSLESNSATKSELSAAQEALQASVDAKASQTDLNSTNSRVSTLEGKVGDTTSGLVKDVADLKTTVGDASAGLVKKVADLESASATHAATTYVDAQDSAIRESVSAEVTRATAAEEALGERIDGTNTDVTNLTNRVTTAEGEIDTLQTDVSNIVNTTIPTLAKQADLAAATERIAEIEADYLTAADTYIFNCGGAT